MNDRAYTDNQNDNDDDDSVEERRDSISQPDVYSAAEKERVRSQLQADIEAFLAQGGQVKQVADNVRADPPRKPDNQYGSSPI